MIEFLIFLAGWFAGALCGVGLMCLLIINSDRRDKTAELILQKIKERKSNCMKDYKDFCELENASFEELYPIAIRLDELDQVIEIVKSCIAAGEDDGK